MSVLFGTAATAELSAELLELTFCPIPAGTYEVGAEDQVDNPVRQVAIDSFELAKTLTTNRQLARALEALGDRRTVLMFESVKDRRFDIVARGTKEEVEEIKMPALREAVASASKAGDFVIEGGLETFDLSSPPQGIIPVTLESHLLEKFDGLNQPALISAFEASAFAALFGLLLPTGEQWEVAAGNLRNAKYRSENALREVAHFCPAKATEPVKSRKPNQYGLYGMLGDIWEAMANRDRDGSENREFRGGAWYSLSEIVRAELRRFNPPGSWYKGTGCRFAR